MYNKILIRFGEISLKGNNRSFFVNKLISNIKKTLAGITEFHIKNTYGRIYVEADNNIEQIIEKLKFVPGIVSLSPTAVAPLNFEDLKKTSLKVFQDAVNKYPTTFKVETRRPNKDFPLQSPEISRKIGSHIFTSINTDNKENKLSVDVHDPEYTLNIEVRKNNIYVYTKIISGPGGLPIGTSGKGLLLLSGGIDSPVAGWMSMKRGMDVEALYFHSFPYTSDRAKEKVLDLGKTLSHYSGNVKLYISHFTDIQQKIKENCPAKYNITIMRRMMFRLAEKIARKYNNLALITGESIGQVASQTLESMNVINAVTNMPIIRPLIALDKTEIIATARKIGTYETSIQPYEDCCTIFVPEHPVTKPGMKDTLEAEKNLKVDSLLAEAMKKIEIINTNF
ncbi:MAG: tRNA uracil 4-sulfurtransferase ThiI [Halanaerobiales bacterium]